MSSSLLKLPLEIRDLIYEELLAHPASKQAWESHKQDISLYYNPFAIRIRQVSHRAVPSSAVVILPHLQILTICRQIRHEALRFLKTQETIEFFFPRGFVHSIVKESSLACLLPARLITQLSISCFHLCNVSPGSLDGFAKNVCDRLPNLKDLTLYISTEESAGSDKILGHNDDDEPKKFDYRFNRGALYLAAAFTRNHSHLNYAVWLDKEVWQTLYSNNAAVEIRILAKISDVYRRPNKMGEKVSLQGRLDMFTQWARQFWSEEEAAEQRQNAALLSLEAIYAESWDELGHWSFERFRTEVLPPEVVADRGQVS